MNRRQLLGMAGLLAAGASLWPVTATAQAGAKARGQFFNVREYGAVGDGKTLDTASINQAIDACHAAGGGVTYLPPGSYLSGTVVLKSNVTLYLEAGATLLASTNIADYAPAGPRPIAHDNQKHLIFARDAENLGLAGPGRLDGQGPAFWVSSGRVVPPATEDWHESVTWDWKPLPRPSPLLEFYNCTNLRIEDVRIENAAGWTLRPIQCESVFIRGLTIKNPVFGINTDGIDLTCSRNVFISDCLIDTGDDAICLKSENPYGGDLRPSKNITITNCVLTSCCNGLKFGTATNGAYENITFSNSVIFNEDVALKARVIAGIALEMVDGGSLEGVVISNIRMQRVRTPIFIRLGNRHPRPDGTPGRLRGIRIDNLHATGAILTSSITGLPDFSVEDVTLTNIRIDTDEAGQAGWVQRKIPEVPQAYPEARMFGRLPAYGLYCRHVKGLRLNQVEFKAVPAEARPAIFCEDVADLAIADHKSSSITGLQAVIKLVQTRDALLHGCSAPAGTGAFLAVEGDKTDHIVLMNSDLSRADNPVATGAEVPKNAVMLSGNVGKA